MRPASLMPAALLFVAFGSAPGQEMPRHQAATAAPSTTLMVAVDGSTQTFTPANFAEMPQKAVTVHNEHTRKDETYTGVAVSDLLAKAGFAVGPSTHRKMLRSYLAAGGTDGYWVLYSVTETEGSEHQGDVIVATSLDGHPLGDDGQFKLVSTLDKKPQRWVRNLSSLRLVTVDNQ